MTSRRLFFSLLLTLAIASVALVGCGRDQKSTVTAPESGRIADSSVQPEGYGAQWPSYSQGYRNSLILSMGYQDIGRYGNVCKVWVQNLVSRVTDGRVTVPSTMSNNYMWNTDPAGHVRGQSMSIQNVQPGQVVQMSWGTNKLHTFILAGKNSGGMYWLDSNWSDPPDSIVRYHYVSYDKWYKFDNLRYSVYTIGW